MRRAGVAIGLAGLLAASGARSSIPPPPPDDAPVIAASCKMPTASPDTVAATVTPLADTPVRRGDAGPMTLQWGVRVATSDPRLDDVTSLAFSRQYGLIGTTGRGDWLTFDLQGGTPAGIKSVGVAPTRGATGRPTSMADLGGSLSFVAFADGNGTIARYALSACGTDATAVPWLTSPSTTPVVVQAAYTYLGIVAADPGHRDATTLSYDKRDVTLPVGANPFVPAGELLLALGNPARIVPYILALTHREGGDPGATLRLVYHEDWADVGGGPKIPPRIMLTLGRTPAAMATMGGRTGVTTAILAFSTGTPGTIDLYRFDIGSADLDPFANRR